MQMSRRLVLGAAACAPLLTLAGCTSLSVIQGYVATVRGFVDKIVPIVKSLDPANSAAMDQVQQNVDAAADAISKLSSADAPDGANQAGLFISWTNELLSVAAALPVLPGEVKTLLGAAQLLLVIIATVFSVPLNSTAPPQKVGAGRSWAPSLLADTTARIATAKDLDTAASVANDQLKAWISSH